MKSLLTLVESYLQAAGFRTTRLGPLGVRAERPSFAGDSEARLIWVAPADFPGLEPALRASIGEHRGADPTAWASLVVPPGQSLTRPFRDLLSEERVKRLAPVQFFDTDFKVDQAPQAHSAIAQLRSKEILSQRVSQPFDRGRESREQAGGTDLLTTLRAELQQADGPRLRLIVGKAGIGKTYLFRSLFAELYSEFRDLKGQQKLRARPIPFLPDHGKNLFSLRTELLVESFLRSDVASPVSREAFEWLLVNGFSVWLFDGLDELYAGDARFFEYLADLLTRQESQAQILIWCRDSLLTTSEAFLELQEMVGDSDLVRVYRLRDWERDSKRQFACLRLEGGLPAEGHKESPGVRQFMEEIEQSQTLRSLSGVPFYCGLLVDEFSSHSLRDFVSDTSLLDSAIRGMIQREVGKGLLELSLLEPNGLNEWLEVIAGDYLERRQVSVEEAQAYGSAIVARGVTEAEQANLLTTLLQFPLFASGPQHGSVVFAHDLIAELLAARSHVKTLLRAPVDVGQRLASIDLAEPNLLRFMANELRTQHVDQLQRALAGPELSGRAYAALLCLYLLARPEADLIRRTRLGFDGRSLEGVDFKERDLSGVSFRTADLSHTRFVRCDLRGAAFEGALLNRTLFSAECRLEGADFGDFARTRSIQTAAGLIEDVSEIRVWVGRQTQRQVAAPEPCPGALQLQHLFGKFVLQDGQPRRDDLKRAGLVAGKHVHGVAPAAEVISACVKRGYLRGPDERDRFRRPAGEKYQHIVEFIRDGRVSEALAQVFPAICEKRGCKHEMRAWR